MATPQTEPETLTTRDNTLFCRYEMKYRIDDVKAEALKMFLKPMLPLDPYSVKSNGYYPISSLYLDSAGLQLCRESLEGKKNRVKIRIRTYSEQDKMSFFEIKRRINTVILKSRAPVEKNTIQRTLSCREKAGISLDSGNLDGRLSDAEALMRFQFYCSALLAKPKVLVRYKRLAYEGGSENRVRVTFDRDLCCKVTQEEAVTMNGPGWQRVINNGEILEIKFTGRYPPWLAQMVKAFGLRAQSVSKYTTSIQQSCLLHFCAPKGA